MIARLHPSPLDGNITANTLPRFFEFAGTPTERAAASMIELHWTDVSGAVRCEMWTWCAAANFVAMHRTLEGWQELPIRA